MADLDKKLESYDASTYFLTNPVRDDMRKADRNATLADVTMYIYQSLVDFQGKWEETDRSSWAIRMPNARYLTSGDTIKNITTGERYAISTIIDADDKIILLDGTMPPQSGDVLELTDDNRVNFVSGYPKEYKDKPENEWVDTITFTIKRRETGTIGRHPFDPPTEIKPRTREFVVDPDYPDCHVMVLGQWFDNLVQFDCWSKTNNRADSLVDWFEDFIYKYTWVWKKNGVNEILYWMRTPDEEVTKWRNDLAVRTVLYYFKTEKIVTVREHDFKQLDLYLEVANAVPSGFYGVGYTTLPPSGKTEILDDGLTAYV